ncbi:uncharacterized protein [Procambarus clarkii]|uniref:uncharacterized protein n=1 Tax=Procambarus clarkii TaxID=6728 RepID=UPI003742C1B3
MAYQLVPEAYRQKKLEKTSEHTFTEFATSKERLFQEWCASRKVKTKEDVEQLILLEDFKDCLSGDLKTYLEEQQVETLSAAATMAEEYILTHRPSARYVPKTYSRYSAKHKPEEKTAPRSAAKSTPDSPRRFSPKRDIMCWTCGKKGHIAARCRSSASNNPRREVMPVSSIVPPMATLEKRKELFAPYTSQGYVSSDNSGVSVNGTQKVILGGFPSTLYVAPLIKVRLESQHFKGECRLAVVDSLPIEGIDVILANDLALGLLPNHPLVMEDPVCEETSPIAVVQTRSQAQFQVPSDLNTLFDSPPIPQVTSSPAPDPPVPMPVPECWTLASLLEEQRKDPQVQKLANTIQFPTKGGDLYVWSNEVLCHRCPPKYPQSTEVGKQIVVPAVFRSKLLETAHADRFAGHGGVSKTFHRLAKCFYWPHMKKDVRRFCKTCHACQMAWKANLPVPKAPLCPIPSLGEPFEHLILDIVGPLPPSTSGVQYLLTILDRVSRYPEATPLKTITAKVLVKPLLWFVSRYGLPKTIQTDQGSNFMSRLFRQQIVDLGIQQITSSAYHPKSQGALERFHQTLKSMLRKFCHDRQNKWVEDLPYLLFAVRSVPNESLGISPFEMIYGHSVRSPLEVARDHWLDEKTVVDVVDWLSTIKGRLFSAWEMAKKTLKDTQKTTKSRYDKRTKQRDFLVGDLVLVCTPTVTRSLSAKFVGPYQVMRKVTSNNYLLNTPDRRKKETLVHVNMIKKYEGQDTLPITMVTTKDDIEEDEDVLTNSEVLYNLQAKLTHVNGGDQPTLLKMIRRYKTIFRDVPGLTSVLQHDVVLEEGVQPIKQHPYRLNPLKKKVVEDEVEYMLKHHLIAPSTSPWSSPILLVPKPGKKYRFCIDYCQVNKVTVAKFDLFKGYWQVPLTDRAKLISAFVTPDVLLECQVMPG